MSTYNAKTTAVAEACGIDLGTANRLLIEVGHVAYLAIQRHQELEQKKKQSPAPKKSPAKKAKTTKSSVEEPRSKVVHQDILVYFN